MKHYEHLTSEQRAQLELLRKQGSGPSAIGRQLGRSKSTISRELLRSGALNAQGTYAASQAQQQAPALAAGHLADELAAAGIRLQVVEARAAVRERLRNGGVDAKLGVVDRFTAVADAVEALQQSTLS